MLSVATLLALAYGTRACPVLDTGVEDAHDRRIAPGNQRTPPRGPTPRRRDPWGRPARTVSVIRHGIDCLRRLLLRGRLWSRVWLMLRYESQNDSDALDELHRGYGNRDMIPVIHVVAFHPHLLGPEQQQHPRELNRV